METITVVHYLAKAGVAEARSRFPDAQIIRLDVKGGAHVFDVAGDAVGHASACVIKPDLPRRAS